MIDVWELCTAYYMPRNKIRKSDILSLLGQHGLELGLQVDRLRPEFGARYREIYQESEPVLRIRPPIEPCCSSALTRQAGIVIAGSAGQKIRSTASLFAEGAIFAGLRATQKDDYPITVQTGHSVSEIILSPDPIDYTGIDSPDFLVVLSADGLAKVRDRIAKLSPSCILHAEESLDLPTTEAQVRRLPLAELGRRVGRPYLATAALAALLGETRIFPLEAFAKAIESFQSAEMAKANLEAVSVGAELAGRRS
jgi:Pyruvate/2-oxoacid:ferredoxin oxidoreductase gamma subunit